MVKMNVVLFYYLFVQFACVCAELNPIKNPVEKCWSNQRFSYYTYIFGPMLSDERWNELTTLFDKYPSRVVGIHNRYLGQV
jgi:hypothetical protein